MPVFASRLLVACGAQRDRSASAAELQRYAGIAPVTERRGKKSWGHWRLPCPQFRRHTFVAGAWREAVLWELTLDGWARGSRDGGAAE